MISHKTLEETECAAWGDLYLSAGRLPDNPCDIKLITRGAAQLSIVGNSNVLALNRVLGLGLDRPITEQDINEIIFAYRDSGAGRFFVQPHPEALTQGVQDLLLNCGFRHYNNWIKLYRDATLLEKVKSDLAARKIDTACAHEFASIVTSCFEWDERLIPWIASTVGRRDWHHYLAYAGAKPVATGAFYVNADQAWIDFAATDADYRGMGAQSLLMQCRIADAIDCGCKTLVVETAQQTEERSAPSHRNMLRFGFKEAYARANFLYEF
jgi:GNAT superfamily N-acetyltransferase